MIRAADFEFGALPARPIDVSSTSCFRIAKAGPGGTIDSGPAGIIDTRRSAP